MLSENLTGKPSTGIALNPANVATMSSAFVGGVGGGIGATIGSIAFGYSTVISSSILFGFVGASVGSGGLAVICIGVIKGVTWLNSGSNAPSQSIQDALNETAEEMAAQLQQPVDLANGVLENITENVAEIQLQEREQHLQIDASITQFEELMPVINQATTQLSGLIEPLQSNIGITADTMSEMTEELHQLRVAYDAKRCALQRAEDALSEKKRQLSGVLEKLKSNQEEFTSALLAQQQQYVSTAARISEINRSQAAEIVSLKTQVRQLSAKNDEFVAEMEGLLAEVKELDSQNMTLKQTIATLSQKLEEKNSHSAVEPQVSTTYKFNLFR